MARPRKGDPAESRKRGLPWPLELLIFGAELIHWTLAIPLVAVGWIYTYLRLALASSGPK